MDWDLQGIILLLRTHSIHFSFSFTRDEKHSGRTEIIFLYHLNRNYHYPLALSVLRRIENETKNVSNGCGDTWILRIKIQAPANADACENIMVCVNARLFNH